MRRDTLGIGGATTDQGKIRYKRGLATWFLAYLTITILGVGLFFLIAAVQHTGSYTHPLRDPSYTFEEPFLPVANLLVWTTFALVYFRKRHDPAHSLFTEARRLGVLWLALALPMDLLVSVVIKSPYSMSAHDFYVGQFPWIYLIYVAVLASPMCAAVLLAGRRRPNAARSTVGLARARFGNLGDIVPFHFRPRS